MSLLPRDRGKGASGGRAGRLLSRPAVRIILVLLLLAVVTAEEYYVVTLRNRIAGQNEEIRKVSAELQTLKNERTALREELSSMKKTTGDKKDGTTPAGNN